MRSKREGVNPLPIAITSLKDAMSREVVQSSCAQHNARAGAEYDRVRRFRDR